MSIWGVGFPGIVPTLVTAAGTTALVAGSETTIATTTNPLVGVPNQDYYPLIIAFLSVQAGNPVFTNFTIAARYAGGSDFDTQGYDSREFAVNGFQYMQAILVGANVRAAANGNVGSGAIQVTALAATTGATVFGNSSKFAFFLIPGPDL